MSVRCAVEWDMLMRKSCMLFIAKTLLVMVTFFCGPPEAGKEFIALLSVTVSKPKFYFLLELIDGLCFV